MTLSFTPVKDAQNSFWDKQLVLHPSLESFQLLAASESR